MRVLAAQTYVSQGVKLGFDFIAPESDKPLPWIVFLHGGGWVSGDRSGYHEEAAWYAEQGFATVCLSYRLAPLHPFPCAVADVKAALAHLKSQADQLGIDAERGAAFGNSAGGHLSLMAALPVDGLPHGEESLEAAVAICPITDLRNPGETHFPISFSFLEQFIPDLDSAIGADVLAQASPAVHLDGLSSHLMLAHGSADDIVPVAQSRDFAKAAAELGDEKGLEVIYNEMPGEGHSFTYPAWMKMREDALAFLQRRLAP